MNREDITTRQMRLMVHTVGASSGVKRNFFGTGKDTKDAKELDKLVSGGFATIKGAPTWSGDDVVYFLTDKGKDAVRIRP